MLSYNARRGEQVAISETALIAPSLRPRDHGYDLVLLPFPKVEVSADNLQKAAHLLQLESAQLSNLLKLNLSLPVANLETLAEADHVRDDLRLLGFETAAVAVADMNLEMPPDKARALEFSDDTLEAAVVGTSEKIRAPLSEIILLVEGRLLVSRTEHEERRKRGRKRTVDSRQLFSDESVLDLYLGDFGTSLRIKAGSFDFSCLENRRLFTAFENFKILINLMSERAQNAQLDNSYSQVRSALDMVWPLEPQTKTGEWRRSGAGKFDMATVTTTDNEEQFTRYSRLRYQLRWREFKTKHEKESSAI